MNNTNQSSEVKTKNITLSGVIAWILGIGCILTGINTIGSKPLVGILYFLSAIILIPPISRGIQEKLHIKLSKSLKVLIVLILLITIASITGKSGTPKTEVVSNSQKQTAVPEQAIKVTASKLVADYKANEVSADLAYKGKLIEVKGTIDTIGKDIIDTPYIALSDGSPYSFERVQCMFTKEQETELSAISKGQSITLQGRMSGKLGNVIVRECRIVS